MARHFISVCMFCLLCATHSPCQSHAEVKHRADRTPGVRTDLDTPHEKFKQPQSDFHRLNSSISSQYPSSTNKHSVRRNKYQNSLQNRLRRSAVEATRNISTDIGRNNFSDSNISDRSNTSDKLEDEYVKKIFARFGDGHTMNMEGFQELFQHLDSMLESSAKTRQVAALKNLAESSQIMENRTERNITCMKREDLFSTILAANSSTNSIIDDTALRKACPAILYNMVVGPCTHKEAEHLKLVEPPLAIHSNHVAVWTYSLLAVFVISACGILGIAVIPIMQKRYYQPMLQFLVALAVGTLAGDALLHLLPHAMSNGQAHSHEHDGMEHTHAFGHEHDVSHQENTWKGCVAMMGLVFFFFVERLIILGAKWRKEKQLKEKKLPKVKVMKSDGMQPAIVGERQCKHKYSSIPYCYDAIASLKTEDYPVFHLVGGQEGIESHNDTATTTFNDLSSDSDLQSFKKSHSANSTRLEANQNMTDCPSDLNSAGCTEINKMLPQENGKVDTSSVEYTVILREHENRHHGHSHTHGHVHAAPKDLSSVAWMVIMGDGLHNFTDGMAIGAAFSSSIAGGFSTTVAVFCHELPHELGDFAMLLKAGMSMKQALFYNILSSVLCLLGNAFGVWLGNIEYATSWVFACAAGTFLYIALVDMIPELSSGHEDETFRQCALHLSGILLGFGIMALIALYEPDLKNIFHETV